MDLAGQVVVITGASSGIGAALARSCSQRGARVALVSRREQALHDVAESCIGETFVIGCDVTSEADRKGLVRRVIDRWRAIDVLINNAGIGLYAPFMDTPESELRKVFEVDFFAIFRMIQLVVPIMQKAQRGALVTIASTGGLIAHARHVSAYLAAKHAVVGMSRGLRRDLEGSEISVQVVCPHLTDTPFFTCGMGSASMIGEVGKLKRFMDTPEDVAEGVLEQIGPAPFIVFPTERARTAFERFKED